MYKRFKVEKKVKENDVVTSFYLKSIEKVQLKKHKAGQFIAVKLNIDGVDEVRQYSLSMKPGEDFYRISVKREEKGLVSRYLHDNVFEGDVLEISEPLGQFILKDSNRPLILMSGGIGITPVMSMLYEASNSGREIIFVQAVLNSSAHTFKSEIKKIVKENNNVQTEVFYSEPLDKDKIGVDYDHLGFVSNEWIEKSLPKDGEFYFCGPLGFMKHIYICLTNIVTDKSSINYEVFGPSADLSEK
ncbi:MULTISPECIES: FAD-binding oxidoreductase [Clostridium]|uniref:FAD-binding oxidoreductase n=1 Tax=Clostridium TaxID=1485 RepID=UPI001FAAFC08|nr:FAD-binding oxidoreductase [Clostridium sp. HBUAS56017]